MRRGLLVQTRLMHIIDNADYSEPTVIDVDATPKQVLTARELFDERFTDDRHFLTVHFIGVLESPSLRQRNTHGFEIVSANDPEIRQRSVSDAFRLRPALDGKHTDVTAPRKRWTRNQFRSSDAWECCDSGQRITKECGALSRFGIPGFRQSYFKAEKIVWIEAWVNLLKLPEAFDHQSSSCQQQQRQRHFRDDQRVTKPLLAHACGTSAVLFQRRIQIDL